LKILFFFFGRVDLVFFLVHLDKNVTKINRKVNQINMTKTTQKFDFLVVKKKRKRQAPLRVLAEDHKFQ